MDMLPLIWMLFLSTAIGLYVLLDGFSLGVGILFPFAPRVDDRDLMMATVSPVWDGNQTWLVGGGTALFAAFPQAYHLLLSALYLPVITMLLALVFRGAAFEFRAKADDKRWWNAAFVGGSTIASFCQGMIFGTYVLGFEFDGTRLVSGAWDFVSPFSLTMGLGVVLANALLGACWLICKTEEPVRAWAFATARRLQPAVIAVVGVLCIWTPLVVPEIRALWFDGANLLLLSPIPIWIGVLALLLFRLLHRPPGSDVLPFVCCAAVYFLTLLGVGISLWPYIVPRSLSFWDAAAPDNSLLFVMVGVLLIVPVVLVYTAHAYYVFRGKVRAGDFYH